MSADSSDLRQVASPERAEIYRRAAERSLLHGNGIATLSGKDEDAYFKAGGRDTAGCFGPKEFCLSLCFAAAMAETGDL